MRNYRNDKGLKGFLENLFKEYVVIFIGSGIQEFEILEHCLKQSPLEHFSLIGTQMGEENLFRIKKAYFREIRINTVPYYLDFQGYAEKAISLGNMKGVACELAKGKTQLFNRFATFLPEVNRNIRIGDAILAKAANRSNLRIFGYLVEYLNALRNVNFVSLCGVTFTEYLLMGKALPSAHQTASGKWNYAFSSTKLLSADDANKVINVIVNLSLKLGQIVL